MKRSALRHLGQELAALDQRHRLRIRPPSWEESLGAGRLNLCANDYLGYLADGKLAEAAAAAAAQHAAGAGASRLVCGEHAAHRELEARIAEWMRCDESLIFTSGYAANVGVVPALAGEGDLVVSDALNHASLIDGCRLSRAEVAVVPHLDLDGIRTVLSGSRARRRWVVTESHFSMDGDGPDLGGLRQICDEWDAALVVDEAHAVGVFGPAGRGRAAEAGVEPDVLIGTLGKALAAQGAFVAGSRELCSWLWNRARSFVFSTGLSPLTAAVASRAVELARDDDAGRLRLVEASRRLRQGLSSLGLVAGGGLGPIIPVRMRDEQAALAWARALGELGILVQAIRPPTVPEGTARLRVTASASLTGAQIDRTLWAFGRIASAVG